MASIYDDQLMKAIVCDKFGWPQSLDLKAWPIPKICPGNILVRVINAGVNFADSLVIEGVYQERLDPPFIPGVELSGVVVEVGEGVTEFEVGDRVMGQVASGAFAEFALLDARCAVQVPENMPSDQAAGFWIPYGTAYCGLVRRGRLREGETLLVSGAAGGVGLAAVEVGVALGARVIALVSGGHQRQEAARNAGAQHVLDPNEKDVKQRLNDLVGSSGVDLAFDVVGGDLTKIMVSSLCFEGRLVVVGFASGNVAEIKLNHALVKNIDIIGFYWGPYQGRFPVETREMFDELAKLYRAGALHPLVSARYPFSKVEDALKALLSRRTSGRIAIDVTATEDGEGR